VPAFEGRRLAAALASAILPGAGQLVNGRMGAARWFGFPILVLLGACALLLGTHSLTALAAMVVAPGTLDLLLAANVVLFGWRLVSMVHAFFDGRYPARPAAGSAVLLVGLLIVIAIPHGIANAWGTTARSAFAAVFAGSQGSEQEVASIGGASGSRRINILLLGVDAKPSRTETLTDSLMVVSVDPVGKTVSLVSLPRDMVGVPLGDGDTFSPKINSLMSYADSHPDRFPQGGTRALEDAVGALLGIHVDYYAKVQLYGFAKLVNHIGGIDINVKRAIDDPRYDGLGLGHRGLQISVGQHHFNGYEALAYARSRQGIGDSDFTRAARQQEVLLAVKTKLLSSGDLLARVPTLLDAFKWILKTDVPTDLLPTFAALADEIGPTDIYRAVIQHPLVKAGTDPLYGSVQIPQVAAIQEIAAALMPAPGTTPQDWPTPKSGPHAPSPSPSASPAPSGG
jgi:polyisoprenyl-teichoic acid--peptidoglycan teichoic acid transferase